MVISGTDLSALVAPAVTAAVVSAIVSIVGIIVSTVTARAIHTEKLEFDRHLALRKFEFDKELAEREFSFEKEFSRLKRRTEIAEETLEVFFKVKVIFRTVRSNIIFEGEGSSRPPQENENPERAKALNRLYVPLERLLKETEFIDQLQAKKFKFMALFGDQASFPFDKIADARNEITWATSVLLRADQNSVDDALRAKCESILWLNSVDDDFQNSIERAVGLVGNICEQVLKQA